LRIYRFFASVSPITLSTPQPTTELAMRSPWVDLLFLHGHANPTRLTWRTDTADGDAIARQIEVDVARLPLEDAPARERSCHA
jgi:hypothetical protein